MDISTSTLKCKIGGRGMIANETTTTHSANDKTTVLYSNQPKKTPL